MNKEKEDTLKAIIDDTIRFGAAIGHWHNSRVSWNRTAATRCITELKDTVMSEIRHRFEAIDRNECVNCHQKLAEKDLNEEEKQNYKGKLL